MAGASGSGTTDAEGKTQGGYTASTDAAGPTPTQAEVYVLISDTKCNGNALATLEEQNGHLQFSILLRQDHPLYYSVQKAKN